MLSIEEIMNLAQEEAAKSLDPSTKVGGILVVNPEKWRIFGSRYRGGHNSFVGLPDPASASREERYASVIHAEEVLIMKAGVRTQGATVVLTHEPCGHCWRLLALAGVSKVIYKKTDEERRVRWGCEKGRLIAVNQYGVEAVEL